MPPLTRGIRVQLSVKAERAKVLLPMDPKYWRNRAAEVRHGSKRGRSGSRKMLAEVAHRYDRLAERAVKLLVVTADNKNA